MGRLGGLQATRTRIEDLKEWLRGMERKETAIMEDSEG